MDKPIKPLPPVDEGETTPVEMAARLRVTREVFALAQRHLVAHRLPHKMKLPRGT